MKKEHLFKTIILLSGVSLSFIKYNPPLLYDFDNLGIVVGILILMFLIGIYLLNNGVFYLRLFILNPKLQSVFSKIKNTEVETSITESIETANFKAKEVKNIDEKRGEVLVTERVKSVFWSFIAIGFGVLSGIYFKYISHPVTRGLHGEKNRIKAVLHYKEAKRNSPFFELDGFYFSWLAFFLTTFIVFIIIFIIRKTILIDMLKAKIKPYLKENH